ncbi:MAG: hypothetical protein JWN67_4179, partial [Actinomycetia bacterium]|nr:hypothetical protein [Actinomycetes bacterium]
DKIAVRLDETERKVRQLPRRLALVGVAAAAVAGIVVLANRPETDGPATQATTTSTAVALNPVDAFAIDGVVTNWLKAYAPGVDAGTRHVTATSRSTATMRFTDGHVATELFLRMSGAPTGWSVASASSDLVLIDNPTYDGTEIVAEAIPAVEGQLTTTFVVDGEEVPGGTNHVTHESLPLGHPVSGAESVVIRVVLVNDEGTIAIAEQPATVLRDPAAVVGSYVALWPATDAVGLASLQQQADNDRRPDLLDPVAVAGNALYELLPRSETSTSYSLGDFQLGDPNSGEVPYTLSDGSSGVVQLRRTAPNDKTKIWYVTGVTSDALQVLEYRHEGRALVIDVQSTVAGTLTLTGGDAPIELQAGLKTHITRPLGDGIQTGAPVELRVRNGRKTLAVLAELPR